MRTLKIPSSSVHDPINGIQALSFVFQNYWSYEGLVLLDFSLCGFITADGAALIASFYYYRKQYRLITLINQSTVPEQINKQLQKWRIPGTRVVASNASHGTSIPLLRLANENIEMVRKYVDRFIVPGINAPNMSPRLLRDTTNNIFEMLNNVFMHSQSPYGALMIGQLYPGMKQLHLCICDAGIGLAVHVRSHAFVPASDWECINWSMKMGNTTKSLESEPGGLGLHLLRSFISTNRGKLIVCANHGFYTEDAGIVKGHDVKIAFRGTLFQVRLQIRADEYYDYR